MLLKNSYLHIYLELKGFHFSVKFSKFYLKNYYTQTYQYVKSLLNGLKMGFFLDFLSIRFSEIFLLMELLGTAHWLKLGSFSYLHVYLGNMTIWQ